MAEGALKKLISGLLGKSAPGESAAPPPEEVPQSSFEQSYNFV